MKPAIPIAVTIALLTVPMSMAQSGGSTQEDTIGDTDQVTFYGHVFGSGLGAPMPANTEAPIGEDNYGLGLSGDCGLVFSACEEATWNRLALYSTAGFVQVSNTAEFEQGGGYAQFHNERGQTKDIQLDTSQSITASAYITLDAHGWYVGVFNGYGTNCAHPHPPNMPCVYPSWGWDPGAYPDVVVKATLYHADLGNRTETSTAPPIEDAVFDGNAKIIAQGQWGPDMVMNGIPGSPNVNEFALDLGPPQVDSIPRTDDFFIVWTVHQQTQGEAHFIDGSQRWWAGEFFAPTFTLPVKNAFTVERVVPNFSHGKLALLGIINTPWGSYDINDQSVELTITGPSGSTLDPDELTRFADFSVAHGGHYKPVNVTWIWDYKKEGLSPGEYTVSVSAENFQGSSAAECSATFTIEEGETGAPVAGTINEGICGTQSTTEADLADLQANTSDEGGSNE